MKKSLSLTLFTLLFLSPALAQWTEIPLPNGAYIYDDMEVYGGKVFTTFYSESKFKCLSTTDYLNWTVEADLAAGASFGGSLVIADEERLYLFGANPNQQSANAWFSEDGGENWETLGLPAPAPHLLAPAGDALLCASGFEVKRSADDGENWNSVLTLSEKIWDLKRTGGQTIMATTVHHIYRSTDQGLSWDTLPVPYDAEGINFPGLTIFPIEAAIFVELDSTTTSKLFRTTDGGESWDLVQVPAPYTDSNVWDLTFAENTLWVAFGSGIASSVDTGATWNFHLTPNSSYQIAAIGDTVFAGGSSGFFKSYDQANTWISGNRGWVEAGIAFFNFFLFETIHADQDKLYLSTIDGLFSTENDGIEWTLHSSHGPFQYHFTSGDTILFLGYGALRSFDGGATWDFLSDDTSTGPLAGQYDFAWVGNYLFAGAWFEDYVYRSPDLGVTWEQLSFDFFFFDKIAGGANTLLYVSDSDGIYISTNNGESFQPFNNGLGNNPYVEGIWEGSGTIFTLAEDQLWRMNGSQWVPASAGLYDDNGSLPFILDINGEQGAILLVSHNDPDQEALLYLSFDGGASWEGGWGAGLPATGFSFQALLRNGTIYALGETQGEFYNRVWKRALPVATDEGVTGDDNIRLFPNPAGDLARMAFPGEAVSAGRILLHDFSGRLLWQQPIAGETLVEIPVKYLPAGIYSVSVYFENGHLKQTKLVVAH